MIKRPNSIQASLGLVVFLIVLMVVGGFAWMLLTISSQSKTQSARAATTDRIVEQYADLYAEAKKAGLSSNADTPAEVQESVVENRKGDTGDTGLPGVNGVNGLDGRDGMDGRDGLPGLQGIFGQPGEPGVIGGTGADGGIGSPGLNGTNGTDGTDGTDGAIGPAGPQGPSISERHVLSLECAPAGSMTIYYNLPPLIQVITMTCAVPVQP